MYVECEYLLPTTFKNWLRKQTPIFGFGQFGEIVYYRTYSRRIEHDGLVVGQETWADTVIRVVEGVASIRLDWYNKNHITWKHSDEYFCNMAKSLFRMEWLPPGRGLWAMGSDMVRERGSMALYNCAFTNIGEDWVEDLCWMMDSLMYGVGVGFEATGDSIRSREPSGGYQYKIPDSREGWVDSLRRLLKAFATGGPMPEFDYSLIRPYGAPIKNFGGTASGPGPLKELHEKIVQLSYRYLTDDNYPVTLYKMDLANLVGVCVVVGNVRRSAEIGLGSIHDDAFLHAKDYNKYPYRRDWGWMSNNSVKLRDDDFTFLDMIAQANIKGHDVGILNMHNIRKGRIGKEYHRPDMATGINPCGEIPLEHREVCNVAETCPTRCADTDAWLRACEYATFYCSTVALLPTHQPSTNEVVNRNRRIGVGIVDFTGWKESQTVCEITKALRLGYGVIATANTALAAEAGVKESIRLTTVKPGGTVPKIAGRSPGMSYPTFRYTLRRINVPKDLAIDKVLIAANIPYEDSVYTPNTHVFEYPIEQGPARPATEVSLWEQAFNLVLLQREWADNAVSNTLYFKPRPDVNHEEDILEEVLASIAPLVKSISVLPHSNQGIFPQMPEEGISREEYERRLSTIKQIDWSNFSDSDGIGEQYCSGDLCMKVN